MKTLEEIEGEISALARKIEARAKDLPTFGRSEDGARPHIEVQAGQYHYVVVERGCELERRATQDFEELLYWVFSDVTSTMAFAFELAHRVEGKDPRRLAFARQLELMSKVSPGFAERAQAGIQRILARAPYNDAAQVS